MPSKRLFVLVSSGPNETTKNRQTKLQRWCLGVDSGSSRLSACMRKNSPGRPKHSASAGLSSTAGQPRTGVAAKTACRPAQPLLSNREINDCFIGRGTNVVFAYVFDSETKRWDEAEREPKRGRSNTREDVIPKRGGDMSVPRAFRSSISLLQLYCCPVCGLVSVG